MSKDKKSLSEKSNCAMCVKSNGSSSAVYGLGFVSAAIYYLQHASTIMAGIVGLLKAMVWPAFLVYKAMSMMGM